MVKKSVGMLRESFREKGTILKAAFLYFLMIAVIYAFANIIGSLVPKDTSAMMSVVQNGFFNIIFIIIIAIAYILLMAFIFSFFKMIIISVAQKKPVTKKTFSILGGFFLFNLVECIIIGAIFLIIGAVLSYTFNQSQTVSLIYAAVFAFFAYPFGNLSQIAYVRELKIFKSMKNGLNILFSQFGHYVRIIITNAVFIGILLLVFLIIGSIYKAIVAKQTSMAYVAAYNAVFIAAMSALFLIISAYNLYFLNKMARESKA